MFFTDNIKSIPNVTPILITIDPERDTAEAMAAYVKGINTNFSVLYGVKLWFINKVESGDMRSSLQNLLSFPEKNTNIHTIMRLL